jgi:hypothetical protein
MREPERYEGITNGARIALMKLKQAERRIIPCLRNTLTITVHFTWLEVESLPGVSEVKSDMTVLY